MILAPAALLLAVWLMAGCQSPTLPLPPPGRPDIAQLTSAGQVTVAGGSALPQALVMMFNLETNSGVIMSASDRGVYTGVISVDLATHAHNTVWLWQRYGSDDSSVDEFQIPYGLEHGQLDSDGGPPDSAQPSEVEGGDEPGDFVEAGAE